MLNELKTLSDSLDANGIVGKTWDKDFAEVKLSSACFIVSLCDDGSIDAIRFISKDQVSALRTWKGGANGETFPAFNFTPFFQMPTSWSDKKYPSKKDIPQRQKDIIKNIKGDGFLQHPNAPVWKGDSEDEVVACHRKFADNDEKLGNADKRTAKCLDEIEQRFEQKVCCRLDAGSPTVRLCRIFGTLREKRASILSQINTSLLNYLRNNVAEDMLGEKNCIARILFGKDDVVLFWDVAIDGGSIVAQESTIEQINEALLADRRESNGEKTQANPDAFGEFLTKSDGDEKMPKVKLPGKVAETILRSMSQDIPCQTRYGLIGSSSFPIAAPIRMRAKSALEWVSDRKREGYTWSMASQSEIVFAYPKRMPPVPPMLASMLGNGLKVESRFAECAKQTLDTLRGLSKEKSEGVQIEVFAICQADKARRKVVFYREYSEEKLRKSVQDWIAGSTNLPPISLRRWPERAKDAVNSEKPHPVLCEFSAPYPLSVMPIVYSVWSGDSLSKLTPGFREQPSGANLPIFDALELLLDGSEKPYLAGHLLSSILQNGTDLLVASANSNQRNEVLSSGALARYVQHALPIIGILLYKQSIRKEKYMSETPYMLGKLLNLADGLHRLWCECVKSNDPLPPVLIGNSFYAVLSRSPIQGLSSLGERLRVYLAWAATVQGEKVGLARWFLKELSHVSDAIHVCGVPQRLTDADKAQMLLGYLASLKSTDDVSKEDGVTVSE